MGTAKSLREQLAERDDLREKTVKLDGLNLEVTIRRATVKERNEMMAKYKEKDSVTVGESMIKQLMVPPLSDDDYANLPSIVADAIAGQLMAFNGWTKQGAAELVDQFPVK